MIHQGVIDHGGAGAIAVVQGGMPSGWWIVPGVLLGLGFWVMVGVGLHGALTSGDEVPSLVTQGQAFAISVTAPD